MPRLALAPALLAAAASAQAPVVDSIGATSSFAPAPVTIEGANFDAVTTVTVAGSPAPVSSWTPTELVVQPAVLPPGFADVVVTNAAGSTTVPGGMQLWPTVESFTTGVGGWLLLAVESGGSLADVAAWGTQTLGSPLVLGGIHHGLVLDPLAPGAILPPGPIHPVPAQPGLIGVAVHLQALSLYGASTSFSDTASETLQSETAFAVEACSLGCSSPGPGSEITCGVTTVAVNEELIVDFAHPVDLASVDHLTFEVVDLFTGVAPPAAFLLDPDDATRLVYRPQTTFDSGGNPVFGLKDGSTYSIRIAGVNQDPLGPYVQSVFGEPNADRLACTVVASGVIDVVPGPPSVATLVDVVTAYDPVTGEPLELAYGVPADGATDVWLSTDVTFVFDDVMNPATLVDPLSGTSNAIDVVSDADGDLTTTGDQVPVPGVFSIAIDPDAKETTVVFDPASDLPPAGGGPVPLQIAIHFDPSIADLVANPLANPSSVSFTPED